jgi:chromosomal replication initiator protein
MDQDNQHIWARVLGDLAKKVRPELVGDWLADLELTRCTRETVAVVAPSRIHAKLVEDHYGELIAEGFQEVLGFRPTVSVEARRSGRESVRLRRAPAAFRGSAYNPAFTLDSFVEGSPSRLALAACRAVADRPGELYNPLFIHGGSGTGKTHLLHAVCGALSERSDVLYLTADEFSSRLAASREEVAALRARLAEVQVLALDDVQTLQGREASQEELFHVFNSLYNRSAQLLFAADASPRALTDLAARLSSRFTWGLIVEIEPPLFENRLEILAAKAAARGLEVAPEVLEELASAKLANVRELEGLLTRLVASSAAGSRIADRELARELRAEAPDQPRPAEAPSSEQIQRAVAAAYGLRPHDLLGPSRTRSVSLARHVAIYLAKRLTPLAIQEIGGHFGGRDHSTVSYAIEKISRLLEKDQALAGTVRRLTQQLTGSRRVSG